MVYRGFVSSKTLFPSLWIDRYDEHNNPNGYQRPHEERRSQLAAEYALNVKGAFWYEAVVNVRVKGKDTDPDVGDPSLGIPENKIEEVPVSKDSRNLVRLSIDYDLASKQIGGETMPWNRAFSVVDSQHRLMGLESHEVSIPICIFIGLSRKQEAVMFKDINENQKPMPTKLVDTILLQTEGEFAHPDSAIAQKLHEDPSSPFYERVDRGGKKLKRTFFATLEGLRSAVELTLGEAIIEDISNARIAEADRKNNLDSAYDFVRNYWSAMKELWPDAWNIEKDSDGKVVYKKFKLLTSTGIQGLSRLARDILHQKCIPAKNFSKDHIVDCVKPARSFDWDKSSRDMLGVAGPGGGVAIYKALRRIVLPTELPKGN